MTQVKLATPPHFSFGKLERIGFFQHFLYVAVCIESCVEVWCVHCFVPSSWRKIYTLQAEELFYVYFTISISQNSIYALVIGHFDISWKGFIAMLRINLENETVERFNLSEKSATIFEEITFETVGLGCGDEKGLFLLDRSIVKGKIPFWRIGFEESQHCFTVKNCSIAKNEGVSLKYYRFPVVLNGDQRAILRLSNNNEVAIYNSKIEKWTIFTPIEGSDLNLLSFRTRGVSETFGFDWHRFSAIESPLSVFVDNEFCIFKVYMNEQHNFYAFSIDESTNTYCLRQCSSTKIEKRLETMFYLHCAEGRRIALVNKHMVGFINIQPPTLRELSFWALQKNFTSKDEEGLWYGGKSENEIQQICGINKSLKLI